MYNDKIKVYLLEFILLIVLVFALFVSNIYKTIYLSMFVFVYCLAVRKIIKKRNVVPYNKKEVVILMIVFAFVYLAIFYLLGFYFGFDKSNINFGFTAIKYFILPLCVLIYSTECIREIFLTCKNKVSYFMSFLITVLIDLIIYAEVYDVYNLDDFLMLLGFIFFASVSSNLLYNYITVRFGKLSIIFYRIILITYIYIIPVVPSIYIFFRTFFRIVCPYFIYLFLENTYGKTKTAISYNEKKKELITTTFLMIVLTGLIMLISCQFKYGILVIGSGSMTGTLNVGDVSLFEKYDGQSIRKGDIIIFKKDGLQIVHRVVDVKNVNNTIRYYTKGDANENMDDGYRISSDINGISRLQIRYLGYPTIWLKTLFS